MYICRISHRESESTLKEREQPESNSLNTSPGVKPKHHVRRTPVGAIFEKYCQSLNSRLGVKPNDQMQLCTVAARASEHTNLPKIGSAGFEKCCDLL